MAIDYMITPSGDQVRVVGTGVLTTRDFIAAVERIHSDPRCLPESSALIDLRDATYEPKDQAEVIDIATALEAFRSVLNNNIAIVARRSTIFFAELFSAHVRAATHVGVRVFTDLGAAVAFCGKGGHPS
ncbi:MAG: hypothetical protein WCS01_08550 [bacterium]